MGRQVFWAGMMGRIGRLAVLGRQIGRLLFLGMLGMGLVTVAGGVKAGANLAGEQVYQITGQPLATNLPELGVNLGEWAAWGAPQFMRNVLKNPGFEGVIDRAVVIVKEADSTGFADDNVWTGRPDGFWDGAQFEVRSGVNAGKHGTVFTSFAKGSSGMPTFKVKGTSPVLQPGDVVSLTLINDQQLPTQWWPQNDRLPGQLASVNDPRPGSGGHSALALSPLPAKPVAMFSYFDAITGRAGKLLPVNGRWKLRFWAKQSGPSARLTVRFRRLNNTPVFFQETFNLTADWQVYERSFVAQDNGLPETLEFAMLTEGDGVVTVDDVELGADANNLFRPELVAALKRLQPGYLRDWQGQLGDTFGNRIADAFGRRTSRYRPGDETTFSYGLNDFLQLANAVNAQPWVVVPPTMGDVELRQLGKYLSTKIKAFGFQELLVEFGNENWNPVFRAAGIPDPAAHGAVADRAFAALLAGAGNDPKIHTVVNGQYVNPWLSERFLALSHNAHGLAVAPYFMFKLDAGDVVLDKLFAQDNFYPELLTATRNLGKDLSVYEVNLHTTDGTAASADREFATASAAAGTALAKRLLTGINLGIKRQCLYTLSQFDGFPSTSVDQQGWVKLWGISRDLATTPTLFRPTGLAMQLLNKILPADVYHVQNMGAADPQLLVSAFHTASGWALAVVSEKPYPQNIAVQLPQPGQSDWQVFRMKSPMPSATNENGENVSIGQQALSSADPGTLHLRVPAYGLMVALPARSPAALP